MTLQEQIAHAEKERARMAARKKRKKKKLHALLNKVAAQCIQQSRPFPNMYQQQPGMNAPGWGNSMYPYPQGYEYYGMGAYNPSQWSNQWGYYGPKTCEHGKGGKKKKKKDSLDHRVRRRRKRRKRHRRHDENLEKELHKKKRRRKHVDIPAESEDDRNKKKRKRKRVESSPESDDHRRKKKMRKNKNKMKEKSERHVSESSTDDETTKRLKYIEILMDPKSRHQTIFKDGDNSKNMPDISDRWLNKIKINPEETTKMDRYL